MHYVLLFYPLHVLLLGRPAALALKELVRRHFYIAMATNTMTFDPTSLIHKCFLAAVEVCKIMQTLVLTASSIQVYMWTGLHYNI